MSTFSYAIKDKYPQSFQQFRTWWIKQVINGKVPCDMVHYDGVRYMIFDDWPFELQAMYYAAFFNEQHFTLSLATVTTERFKALVEACFARLEEINNSSNQKSLENEVITETTAQS